MVAAGAWRRPHRDVVVARLAAAAPGSRRHRFRFNPPDPRQSWSRGFLPPTPKFASATFALVKSVCRTFRAIFFSVAARSGLF